MPGLSFKEFPCSAACNNTKLATIWIPIREWLNPAVVGERTMACSALKTKAELFTYTGR